MLSCVGPFSRWKPGAMLLETPVGKGHKVGVGPPGGTPQEHETPGASGAGEGVEMASQ